MAKRMTTATIFKALMHPARLSILEILRSGEQCVCHLEAALDYRQAYISQHLMILRKAGLVEDRRDGARVFYRVTKPEVFHMVDEASEISGTRPFVKRSGKLVNCPCPKCTPVDNDEDPG